MEEAGGSWSAEPDLDSVLPAAASVGPNALEQAGHDLEEGCPRMTIRRTQRGSRPPVSALVPFVVAAVAWRTAASQEVPKLLQQALVIQNARVLTMADSSFAGESPAGAELERATIIARGGRIETIARDPELPFLKRVFDAEGKTVTPGFIDVHSALGMSTRTASANVMLRSVDGFDRYATRALNGALRQGVTAVYVSIPGAPGVHGRGAIVRLQPGDGPEIGEPLVADAALEIDLGSRLSPLARIKTLSDTRKRFESARDYREALDLYEEELKEYEEKLAERARAKEKEKNDKKKDGKPQNGKKRLAAGEKKSAPAQKKKDDDAPKKPRRPRYRPEYDVLLSALDGEIPVRVEVNRSDEILNAIELADELGLDLVLVGASEAHLVATEIPEEVPVVLETMPNTAAARTDEWARGSRETASVLSRAGRRVLVGSGARSAGDSRFVAFHAQLAAPGEDPRVILRRLTADAADLLRVAGEIGRVRPGLRADLVIWSGDPLDPASRVEKVFVGGKLAYDSSEGER